MEKSLCVSKRIKCCLVYPLLCFGVPLVFLCRLGAWRCPSRLPLSALFGGVPCLLLFLLGSLPFPSLALWLPLLVRLLLLLFLVVRCRLLCRLLLLPCLVLTLCLWFARTVVFVSAVSRTLFVPWVVLFLGMRCLLVSLPVLVVLPFALLLRSGTLLTLGLWLLKPLEGFLGWLLCRGLPRASCSTCSSGFLGLE